MELSQRSPIRQKPPRSPRRPQARIRAPWLRLLSRGPAIAASQALWERALRVIPTGTQTLSKGPSQFVEGFSPKFLRRGRGCHVWDVDGNEYIDYPMALGPILLGYDFPAVSEAVIAQVREGTTFTLMHPLEVEVAELLVELVPCAERVRFAKNGADATGGAIRAARAATGREHVVATGYHGYHDWYIASTERHAGVPRANRDLIHTVAFDDLAALEQALGEREVAAVIMEIPGHEPSPGYLPAALEACPSPRRALDPGRDRHRLSLRARRRAGVVRVRARHGLSGQGHGQRLSTRRHRRRPSSR